MPTLGFDDVLAWLDERLDRASALSVGTPSGGNTGTYVNGTLRRVDDGEVSLIDPRPGRVETYAVGEAVVVMLEGDFADAELVDCEDPATGVSLTAEFEEITLIFTVA